MNIVRMVYMNMVWHTWYAGYAWIWGAIHEHDQIHMNMVRYTRAWQGIHVCSVCMLICKLELLLFSITSAMLLQGVYCSFCEFPCLEYVCLQSAFSSFSPLAYLCLLSLLTPWFFSCILSWWFCHVIMFAHAYVFYMVDCSFVVFCVQHIEVASIWVNAHYKCYCYYYL